MFLFGKNDVKVVGPRECGIAVEKPIQMPYLIKGQRYSLKGVACDGFEMPSKTYELVGIVEEYGGTPIQSVVMKQVEGEQDVIFTLSKYDCECLGIEYEQGLQLWPKQMKWEMVKDECPFDPNDLSTLPRSDIDNTIRCATIVVRGFGHTTDGAVLSPDGRIFDWGDFHKRLRITCNKPILLDGRVAYAKGQGFNTWFELRPPFSQYPYSDGITSMGHVHIYLDFSAEALNVETIDGRIGWDPSQLKGMDICDIFSFGFDSEGLLTEDETRQKQELERERKERLQMQQQVYAKIANEAYNSVYGRVNQSLYQKYGYHESSKYAATRSAMPWEEERWAANMKRISENMETLKERIEALKTYL